MEKVVLNATKRTVTGKHVANLRREGKLPGVLYGHNVEPIAITMDLRDASNILSKLSGSSLVNVNIDGQEHAALVREKQRNYIKGSLIHVDFQVVSLTEKLRTEVSINLVGTSPLTLWKSNASRKICPKELLWIFQNLRISVMQFI